jgi:hypothetical protein
MKDPKPMYKINFFTYPLTIPGFNYMNIKVLHHFSTSQLFFEFPMPAAESFSARIFIYKLIGRGYQFLLIMKTLFIFISIFAFSFGRAQMNTTGAEKILTAEDGNLSVAIKKNGQCYFVYQNGMSTKKDKRNIVFKNKQDIRSFEKRLSRALSAKDGSSDIIQYKLYKIRLLTEIGGVFMIVSETGQTQSTLRISKEMYSQVNAL